MALASIRAAATQLIKDAEVVKAVYAWPPEKAPQLVPAAWFDFGKATIKQGARSEWSYELKLYCAVFRRGDLTRELAGIEPLAQQIEDAFTSDYTLGALTSGFQLTNYQEAAIGFADNEGYIGFVMTFRPIERRTTTLEG